LSIVLEDGKPVSDMPKQIVIASTFYDKSNADDFVPARQRKLTFDNLPLYEPNG
jgi:hypothetical protein